MSGDIPKELLVDEQWYRDAYPGAALLLDQGGFDTAESHYQKIGTLRNHWPNPFFDTGYYRIASGFARDGAAGDPRIDYVVRGAASGATPNPLFFEGFFQQRDQIARWAIQQEGTASGYLHFLHHGSQAYRPIPLFDRNLYISAAGLRPSASLHECFQRYMRGLGRSPIVPCRLFDEEFYATEYDLDLVEAKRQCGIASLFYHFCSVGLRRDWTPLPDLDIEFYLNKYPDAQKAIKEKSIKGAVFHFLIAGIPENRQPNENFNPAIYLEYNPEIVSEIENNELLGPFEHFIAHGKDRGLRATRPIYQYSISEKAAKLSYNLRTKDTVTAVHDRGLSFKEAAEPDVSIIIPVYNQYEMTVHLLYQIALHTSQMNEKTLEVIVVDNGSTDRTLELPSRVSGIKVIRRDSPIGYTKACNLGASAARAPVLLFTNNDIELGPNAIIAGLERVLSDKRIGALGSKVLLMNGCVQEAGSIIFADGSCSGFKRGASSSDQDVNVSRDVDYCSGCFLFVRTEIFRTLNGFDEAFSPGYYEETDLCLRMREAGFRIIYEPRSTIYHFETASFLGARPKKVSETLMRRNQLRFFDKHRQTLATYPSRDIVSPANAAYRHDRPKPHVLMVEDLAPDPRLGSGFVRANDIVNKLCSLGWRVSYFTANRSSPADLERLNLEGVFVETDGNRERLRSFAIDNYEDIDLLWVCRSHNFGLGEKLGRDLRRRNHNVKIVFDSEAITTPREVMRAQLVNPDYQSGDIEDRIREEVGKVSNFDVLVVVNQHDCDLLPIDVQQKSAIVGHSFLQPDSPAGFESRHGFVFVGAVHSMDSPNYDSMLWFLESVWPNIREKLPSAELNVVGPWNTEARLPDVFRSAGVRFVGKVETVEPYFDKARVALAPTRFAAGMPHKVEHAFSRGTPVAMSAVIGRQVDHQNRLSSCISDDPDSLAEICVRLHEDSAGWSKVQSEVLELIEKSATQRTFSRQMQNVLTRLGF